jgi:hypothetical protein
MPNPNDISFKSPLNDFSKDSMSLGVTVPEDSSHPTLAKSNQSLLPIIIPNHPSGLALKDYRQVRIQL